MALAGCSDQAWYWPWEDAPAHLTLPGVAYSGDQAMLSLGPAGQPLANPSLIQIQHGQEMNQCMIHQIANGHPT